MTTPVQDSINAASQPGNAVAQRAQMLQEQHPWLDPATTTSLAQSSGSDQTILAQAGAFKSVLDQVAQTAGSAISQVGHFFEDPVLNKKPTAGLMLQQYLMQRQGWLPVAQQDLSKVQQQLQSAGYGKGLSLSGVWTPDWQQQFRQASSDHLDAAAKANNGAGMDFGKATHGFLSAMMPSHWIPALVGFGKSLPGGARDLAAEVYGDLGGVGEGILHPSSLFGNTQAQQKVEATRQGNAASVESALGNPNAQDAVRNHWHLFLNAINAELSVAGGAKLASVAGSSWVAAQQAIKDAGGEGVAKGLFTDLGKEAAQRGPGVLSQTLYRYGESGQKLGLLNTRLFANSPVLKQLTMPLRAITDPTGKITGYYYTARTALAQPYRIAGVQLAGAVGQNAALAGAGVRGLAAAETKLPGGHPALADQIYAQHTIGGPFGTALDMLSAGIHGPLGKGQVIGVNPSQTVGDLVHSGNAGLDAALRPLGTAWAFEAGTGIKYADLVKQVGEAKAQWFLNSKLNEFAATHFAHSVVDGQNLVGNDWQTAFRDAAHTAYHNADLLDQHRGEVTSNMAELAHSFFKDSNAIIGTTKQSYSNGISSLLDAWTTARSLFTNHASELVTPITRQEIRFAQGMGDLPAEGMTRLYRGVAPGGENGGRFFTPFRDIAERYAGEGGAVHHVDVPSGAVNPQTGEATGHFRFNLRYGQGPEFDAARAASKDYGNEYLLPPETAVMARPVSRRDAPGAYRGWLRSNNPVAERGSFGIARLDTQTKQDAVRKAGQLREQLGRAVTQTETGPVTKNAALYRQVRRGALDYLTGELGVRENELERLDTAGLVDLITAKADTLSRDVHLPLDPSPQAVAHIAALRDKGYKPVFGTDIGHAMAPPMIEPMVIDGAATKLRKAQLALGLGNLPVSTTVAGGLRREQVIRDWQTAINDGKLRLPPNWNANRMWEYLHGNLEQRAELSKVEGGLFKFSGKAFQTQIDDRASLLEATGLSRAKATAQARQEIEAHIARGTQPLEVTQKQFVKALQTVPSALTNELRDMPADMPLMDTASAKLAHGIYLSGMAHEPLWAFGLGKIEDLFRAGFGFLGSPAAQVPIVNRLAVLPNELARFRNKYRFAADPMFSARRISKTALKMGLQDVPFTVRPYDSMVKQGTIRQDLATLNRIMPDKMADGFDNMDRALHQQDVFGLYNPRHFMAFAAGHWSRQGLDDAEIKRLLTRTFTYGDRTAAERTVSTFFYPFSFEKTLYRNLGGYMLDHPGQRMAVAASVQAYDALSKHADIGDWLKQHAPILKEFRKLNAFEHGVGPGQLGGINAAYAPMLWNVFGPQKYGAMKEPELNAVLQTFPILRDLNSMLYGESVYTGLHHGGTLLQQAGIGYWGMRNAADDVTRWMTDNPRSQWNPQHPALTYASEQDAAWSFRNAMIMKLAPVLDYNYHHQGSELRFTNNDALPEAARGMPISRGSIDELVHRFYPGFDPSVAQSLAVQKQTEEARYLAELRVSDKKNAKHFDDFAAAAKKIMPVMQRAETDPAKYAELAQLTAAFRQFAVNMSEQDPRFLKFYVRYYASRFGPIQELSL